MGVQKTPGTDPIGVQKEKIVPQVFYINGTKMCLEETIPTPNGIRAAAAKYLGFYPPEIFLVDLDTGRLVIAEKDWQSQTRVQIVSTEIPDAERGPTFWTDAIQNFLHHDLDAAHRTLLSWEKSIHDPEIRNTLMLNGASWWEAEDYILLLNILLRDPAKINVNSVDANGATSLIWTATREHVEALHLLIQANAHPDVQQESAVHTALTAAVRAQAFSAVKILLNAKADVERSNNMGHTPLLCAAATRSSPLVRLLLDAEANPESPRGLGKSPLSTAAWQGSTDVTNLLLERSARLEQADCFQYTPLIHAVTAGHAHVVDLLLSQKADPNAADVRGETPFTTALTIQREDLALKILNLDTTFSPVMIGRALYLCLTKNMLRVAVHLVTRNADVNWIDPTGNCMLHYVVKRSDTSEAITFLLNHDVNVEVSNTDGHCPLHIAALYGHEAVCDTLLQSKAGVDPCDEQGNVPLHYAAMEGHWSTVKLLLNRGSNPKRSNKRGETAVQLAENEKHYTIVKLIDDTITMLDT